MTWACHGGASLWCHRMLYWKNKMQFHMIFICFHSSWSLFHPWPKKPTMRSFLWDVQIWNQTLTELSISLSYHYDYEQPIMHSVLCCCSANYVSWCLCMFQTGLWCKYTNMHIYACVVILLSMLCNRVRLQYMNKGIGPHLCLNSGVLSLLPQVYDT